jgi:ATP-dependent RNA helicase RhlE
MTAPTVNDFQALGLSEPLLRALAARDYATPTPIQARSIPHLLAGRDLLGIAQTGTGKTAAFALPMLQLLTASNHRPRPRLPRSLVLAPTRELATQIADSFDAYGKHLHQRVAIVFGGVGQQPQVNALQRGVDILVATPGRLLDLMQQRHCALDDVEILVLDEADRMLDMGFLPDVRRILAALPKDRQSLLFSATMPQDITSLAHQILRDPLRVEVTPPAATADRVEQFIHHVPKAKKRDLLVSLLEDPSFVRTLVFTRTKHGADRVARGLKQAGFDAHAIHGNKSQGARERALDAFRDGKAHVLVATDIAARGIDVPDITHVVNFDLPNIPESYVHRIGRTARAGRAGIAISFCDSEEREYLRDIEKLIRKRIPVVGGAPAATRPSTVPVAHRETARPQSQHRDGNPWLEQADEVEVDTAGDERERAPQRPPQRNRPEPRQAPGPYVPQPERQRNEQQRRPRHERRGGKRHGRPAMPNAVDPEQRRSEPSPRRQGGAGDGYGHAPSRPHGGGGQRHAPSRPHGGGGPGRGPAPHGHGGGQGHRGQGHRGQGGGSGGGGRGGAHRRRG